MKTMRTVQFIAARSTLKATPQDLTALPFTDVVEMLRNQHLMAGVSPERYAAMVLCVARNNITYDDLR